jgi:ubiquinone/menaquinone biosynthesis C-methylase UbiE
MAIGALAEKGLEKRAPTAAVALLSAPILDNPQMWHALEYSWPEGSPAILQFLPYPHDLPSILILVALVVLTIGVAILLRHYWWGMLWAVSPDIIDWLILRPAIGRAPIHDLFGQLSTPWGFAVEVTLIVVIVGTLVWRRRAKAQNRASSNFETNSGVDEMNEQKDKPISDSLFRMMSLLFRIRDRFMSPRKHLEKVGIKEGQTVLDFGCGSGSYAIPAARMVGEKGIVYALDIHPLAMRAVERKANKERLTNITTILSHRDTGLPDERIDVVLLYDTIHMIKDKRALLTELHRVMKPNGLLSILARHIKVDEVLEIVGKDGMFSLKERHGSLLNFERG